MLSLFWVQPPPTFSGNSVFWECMHRLSLSRAHPGECILRYHSQPFHKHYADLFGNELHCVHRITDLEGAKGVPLSIYGMLKSICCFFCGSDEVFNCCFYVLLCTLMHLIMLYENLKMLILLLFTVSNVC